MKKILLIATLCSSFLMANIEDYKKGFEAAIESMRLQVNLNNVKPERIVFKNDNILYIDITKLDTVSILLIQNLANTNSFQEVYLSKNKLFLGSFERVADVNKYQVKAESILGEKVLITKKIDVLNEYTNPLFFKDFYNSLITGDNKILIKEPVYIKEEKKRIVKPVQKKVQTPKRFELINEKAQSYSLALDQNITLAKNFKEGRVVTNPVSYKYEKSITTGDGKTFIKVVDENLYFLKEDVRF